MSALCVRRSPRRARRTSSERAGRVWGRAILTGNATAKPVFVTVGHRFGTDSAVRLVRRLCKYRVPEPIRVADLHSREALRTNKLVQVWDETVFGKRDHVS